MSQPSSIDSACAAQRKMLLLRLLAVIHFAAVCAAQDNVTEVSSSANFLPTTFAPTTYVPPVPHLNSASGLLDVFPTEKVQLTCEIVDAAEWTLNWFLDGQKIPEADSNVILSSERSVLTITAGPSSSGLYSCQGVHKTKPGAETRHSNTAKVTVHEKPSVVMSKSPDFGQMYSGETVTFTCTISWEYGWEYVFSHRGKEIHTSPVNTYTIQALSPADSGQYTCKVRRAGPGGSFYTREAGTSLHIPDVMPQPTLRRSYGFDLMYVRETVDFTCTVDTSAGWTYTWYKDGEKLSHNSPNISITLKLTDAGNYSCTAARGGKIEEESKEIRLSVLEIPVPSLRNVTEWLDVFPGESVKLSCGIGDSSDWTYVWYKDGREIEARTASFDASGAALSITSAAATHAAQYKCLGRLKDRSVSSSLSSGLTLKVYGEKPTAILTRDPDYEQMFPSESVTFTCHMKVSSGWDFDWYKDDVLLSESSNRVLKASVDDGLYKCRAKRGKTSTFVTAFSQEMDLNVEMNKPIPSVTQNPDTETLYAGETVTFECEVKGSGWEYEWFKNGQSILRHSSRFVIHSTTQTESGTYHCMAVRNKTNYNTESEKQMLNIFEIPVPHLKQTTPWLEVFPDETVSLGCRMSERASEWTYAWYRDGKEIQPDPDLSFEDDNIALTIQSASSEHSGHYSCMGRLKARPVSSRVSSGLALQVYDAPPNVTLTQTPEHGTLMHTGDELLFSCHVSVSSEWKYMWYKDDQPVSQFGPNYTINSVWTTHAGWYKCQVKRGVDFKSDSLALKLEVEERPQAEISLLTGWSEAFSTDTLVLQCSVENTKYAWNYTWFKEGQEVKLPPAERHMVTPQDDPEQSSYTCQGIRDVDRPFYSRPSEKRYTKNVLLKRRVLLSISGCTFFGIIAVFIGCIFLRVTRKPAVDPEQREENLFLTMAQLKDCADAPCPLVGYITEDDLNAPPKEEENGTMCSETIPLPITTDMDQAATTENHDKNGSNGEMVSFKQ